MNFQAVLNQVHGQGKKYWDTYVIPRLLITASTELGRNMVRRGMYRLVRKILVTIIILLLANLALNGCRDRKPKSGITEQDWADIVGLAEKSAKNKDAGPTTKGEGQIYDFIESVRKNYETTNDFYTAEALVYIEASKKFNKPVIEIYRNFTSVKNAKSGTKISQAEIDYQGIKRLREIGFYEINGKWYFSNDEINMGTPLPIPQSNIEEKPVQNKCFEVTLETDILISEPKKVRVNGETNLPDETELNLCVSSQLDNFSVEEKVFVRNGKFQSSWFLDSSRPADEIAKGTYLLEISTPAAAVLCSSVREIVGDSGKYMTGKLVSYDEVSGNRVKYCEKFDVP